MKTEGAPSVLKGPSMFRRAPFLLLSLPSVCVAIGTSPGIASAMPKVTERAVTTVSDNVSQLADGTIVGRAAFSSPNPHCLEASRWPKSSDGTSHYVGELGLSFGGSWQFRGKTIPFGAEGAGELPGAESNLRPLSKPGRSPYVWEARIAPTDRIIGLLNRVTTPSGTNTHSIEGGFAAWQADEATAAGVVGLAPASKNSKHDTFVTKYDESGQRVTLECGTAPSRAEVKRLKNLQGKYWALHW